ncbi:hypothetical protein [Rhizobium sp. BK176]|uniref:hypothetical protein n=1 Tax=Rhizobium sp. BK176 TaxID=2587071 RepID=UPI002169973E|nr:hypothetical protein [Rhizobium sp. BK176]MCS4090170.1 hypothetical protein [Rhizobium sp. BK176]
MQTPSSMPSLAQGLLLFFELYASALVIATIGLWVAVLGMRTRTKRNSDGVADQPSAHRRRR